MSDRQKVCKEKKKHPKNDCHGKGYEYGIQYCQIGQDAERGTAFSTIGR